MYKRWQQMYSEKYFHLYSGCIQLNCLARAFDFAVRYTKGEEKVCVLDCNPWLAKMAQLLYVYILNRCQHNKDHFDTKYVLIYTYCQ